MHARVAEHIAQQLGRRIGHQMLLVKAILCRHKGLQFHNALHAVQIAQLRLQRSQSVDHAQPRCRLRVLQRQRAACLARVSQLPVLRRNLPGNKDQIARPDRRNILRRRLAPRRKLNPQCRNSLFCFHLFSSLLGRCSVPSFHFSGTVLCPLVPFSVISRAAS